MKVNWFGQSTYALHGSARVFVDPFGNMDGVRARGMAWNYPPIPNGTSADLLLVTHEHSDHNAVEVVTGNAHTVRSQAGTFETPAGTVIGVASEHDGVAGTQRGANVIYVFELDGIRVCHLGDIGQPALRPEQVAAIGRVDLLFVPVGGVATIDGAGAAEVVRELRPRWAVPMHYRTPAIGFLETADAFLAAMKEHEILTLKATSFETDHLPGADNPVVVVPRPPDPV